MPAMDWSSHRDICSVHSKSLMLRPPRFELRSTRSRLDSLRRRTRHPIPPLPALPRIGRSRKMKRARQDTAFDEEACIRDVAAVIRQHSRRVQDELRAQLSAAELEGLLVTLMDRMREIANGPVPDTPPRPPPDTPPSYAVRRTTISISKDMVKHHIQIQGARHVAQLNTVASKDKGGKMFAPQHFFRG